MWRCAWPCVRLLRCPPLYTTRRHCSTVPANANVETAASSTDNVFLVREQLQRLAQETQVASAAQPTSTAWQKALEFVQAGTGSPGDVLACNDVATLECVLYICLQNARTLADAQPPAELCRALYERCHALRCNDTNGVNDTASPAFAPYADLHLNYARHLWRIVCIHSSQVREHREQDTRTVPLTAEILRVLLLDAPRAGSRRAQQQGPTSLRLVLQGLCELQKYKALLPSLTCNTADTDRTAHTNDVPLLLLLSWLRQPCGAADMDDRSAMSNAVRALYTQPWCNADEVALQCLRHTIIENKSKKGASYEALANVLLLYVHYALQRMRAHSDELERQVCRLTHTVPQYNSKEGQACDGYAEVEQVAPVLQALLTALLQLKDNTQDEERSDEEEEGKRIQTALLHALVQPLAGRPAHTSTSSTSSPRPRFVLCVWVVRTLLTWLRSAQSTLVHPEAHQTEAAMEAAMQTWQGRSECVVYFLRDLLLALPIHNTKSRSNSNSHNNSNNKSLTSEVRRYEAAVQTGQAVWRAVLEAAIEGVFANHAYTPEVTTTTPTPTTTAGDTTTEAVLAAKPNTNTTSLVMQELLLPLYDTMHWRWQTVNCYVVLLQQWEQHTALRAVFTYIQSREARAQRRYYDYLQQKQQQHEEKEERQTNANSNRESTARNEARYRPALTMSSCRHIFASCCRDLRDPHTSAELVRYMLLVLRVAQEEAGNSNAISNRPAATSDVSEAASDAHEEEEQGAQRVGNAEDSEEAEVVVDGEPLRQWLAWISAECIPAVGRLFAERGLDKQGDWLERY